MDPTRVKSPIELELLERARTLIPVLQSRSAQVWDANKGSSV